MEVLDILKNHIDYESKHEGSGEYFLKEGRIIAKLLKEDDLSKLFITTKDFDYNFCENISIATVDIEPDNSEEDYHLYSFNYKGESIPLVYLQESGDIAVFFKIEHTKQLNNLFILP